jgi:hypothetical protein
MGKSCMLARVQLIGLMIRGCVTFPKVSFAALPRSPKWGGAATPEPGFSDFSAFLAVEFRESARDWFDILNWIVCDGDGDGLSEARNEDGRLCIVCLCVCGYVRWGRDVGKKFGSADAMQ